MWLTCSEPVGLVRGCHALRNTDRDLAQPVPNAKGLADYAEQLEKSLKKWQKQHRQLGLE